MREKAPQEIRERVWVEKFDHEQGPEPVLVERKFVQQTKRILPDGTVEVEVITEEPEPEAQS